MSRKRKIKKIIGMLEQARSNRNKDAHHHSIQPDISVLNRIGFILPFQELKKPMYVQDNCSCKAIYIK